MPDSSPRIRAMPRVPPEARRAAAVTGLLALAAIGLRAPGAWPAMGHAAAFTVAGRAFTAVFGAAEGAALAACALLTAVIFRAARRRRKPGDDFYVHVDPPIPWSARAFALLLALAVLAVPFVLLGLQPRHRHPPGRSAVTAPPPVTGHAAGSRQAAAGTFTWALAAGLAAAALAAIAFALWARHRRPGPPADKAGRPAVPPSLATALSAGTTALQSADDPRTAIIACYAAMERNLAGAGSAPSAADTPAEVLARASAAGLVRSTAAGALAALFRRARYSDHAAAEADRTAALRALDELRADLAGHALLAPDLGETS